MKIRNYKYRLILIFLSLFTIFSFMYIHLIIGLVFYILTMLFMPFTLIDSMRESEEERING